MALTELQILFRRCLYRRMSPNDFREILKQYNLKQKTRSRDIVSAYMNCCINFCVEGDPLLPGYLQEILLSDYALVFDFLSALLLQWKAIRDSSHQQATQKIVSSQTKILTELNIILATNINFSIEHLRKCIVLTAKWLTAMAKWALNDEMKDNVHAHNLTEVLGFLLVSQMNFNTIVDAPDMYNAVQQALEQCMGSFPSVSMELMNRLSTIQKPEQETSDVAEPHMMEMAAMQFEEGIPHTSIVPTKSATTALVQHLINTASTIDDSVVYAFLNLRYSANHALMFTEIVSATFDAMLKTSDELYQAQCQIFLFNKLPSILAITFTSSFETFDSEKFLQDAVKNLEGERLDLVPVGRKFLLICSYLHLVSAETAAGLTLEDGSLKGLYAKDDLVAQVTANHTRGPRLVDELLKNDGNAGSISQAIYEIMNNYCLMRETQHLKDMSNTIVRKPAAINVIGMFIKPAVFLTSLCTLLDEWKWDDIHGESQPVYDEFGSVLLLVLAFKQRLRLTESELGIQQKGFLARYFASNNTEQVQLSESAERYLGDWIKSLYIDEGLSDELTANCSAQEFYLLVPTLLRQSVSAHAKGKLSYDALKAGLEYLLEPFLLPSLLPAFGWIEHIAAAEPKTAQLVTQIFMKQPGGEARETYQTIIAMAADKIQLDLLPKTQFSIEPPQGDLTQMTTETYVSVKGLIDNVGPLHVVNMLIPMLLEGDFHVLLDFVATMVVVSDLRTSVQVLHAELGHYLKKGEGLFAEAIVHFYRRVENYAEALTPQAMAIEPFVPMNAVNVNLDAVPETFQAPEQNEDIDQVLNEAAAMGMDQLDSTNLEDMYLQGNDFGLGSLDDLDLDMF